MVKIHFIVKIASVTVMVTLKGLRQNPASYPVMDFRYDDSYYGSVVGRNHFKKPNLDG
jgi:hypothetical protein